MITVEIDGRVAAVTLDRPERLNAFTGEGYAALAEALAQFDADDAIATITLQGAGRAFSSGVDLDALRHADMTEVSRAFRELVGTLSSLRTPLVAGVHGPAIGFGATILLHCDVVLVAHDARIRFPFTELGTVPEAGSSVLLARVVGAQRAAELVLTARWLHGDEAVAIGLAAEAVAADALPARLRELAQSIARHPSPVLYETKRLMHAGVEEIVSAAVGREMDAGGRLNGFFHALGDR
jgi:enoyl-CoA hydratase/carnithine racemase